MWKTPLHTRLQAHLPALVERIQRAYGENLLGVLVFGSGARGDFSLASDLDLLIVLRSSGKGLRERVSAFFEAVGDTMTVDRFSILLSPLVITQEEAQSFHPLYLEILQHHLLLYDPEHFLARWLEHVRHQIQTGSVEAFQGSRRSYWRIKR